MSTVADRLIENNNDPYSSSALHIYKKISDPLLANYHYPQISKKAYLPQLRQNKGSIRDQRGSHSVENSRIVLPYLMAGGIRTEITNDMSENKAESHES